MEGLQPPSLMGPREVEVARKGDVSWRVVWLGNKKAALDKAEAEGKTKKGRKREKPWPTTVADFKTTMDGEAYAYYIEDLAAEARNVLGASAQVSLYHDGVGWHDSPPPAARMESLNVVSLGKPPARSPDMNCIENLFGWAEKRLDEAWLKKRPKNAAETEQRFADLCTEAEETGEIKALFSSMPRRFKAVIDADGGPTRY